MKILSLEIEKLFGTFDYKLTFQKEDVPFIITGCNGYGKTTILTILDKLILQDFFYFYTLKFDSIKVEMADGGIIDVLSVDESLHLEHRNDAMRIDSILNDNKSVHFTYTLNDSRNSFSLGKSEIMTIIQKMNQYVMGDVYDSELYERDKVIQYITDYSQEFGIALRTLYPESAMFSMVLGQAKVTFVESQRLYAKSFVIRRSKNKSRNIIGEKYTDNILEISNSIKDQIVYYTQAYLEKSSELDEQWADILLSSDEDSLEEETYNQMQARMLHKTERLVKYGLLEKQPKLYAYKKSKAAIITAYIKTMQDKLAVFDEILAKIELFDNLISSLQYINKVVCYDKNEGLCIRTIEGNNLPLTLLSSGEQNEIIMLYRMVFDVEDNSILLVDEPENSLHLAWQNKYIDHLESIMRTKNLQVIIATHSPHIIGGRWKDCYDLTKLWADGRKILE